MSEQHQHTVRWDGTRSRTGCITCRIRKKKCDERRPECHACSSRELVCYGFNVPAPIWFTNKTNWKDVKKSDEAKHIRSLASNRYKLLRRTTSKANATPTLSAYNSGRGYNEKMLSRRPLELSRMPTLNEIRRLPPAILLKAGVSIWQLRPETVWWDSKLRILARRSNSFTNENTRLLMIFMEVIHPICFTFDCIDSDRDRSWMLERLVSKEALFYSALSISACFEKSLRQPPKIDDIGISPKVRNLQSKSICELQTLIDEFALMKITPVEEFIWTGIQILDVVIHLEMLEICSMLQGHWETHHRALRKIMNHIEICAQANNQTPGSSTSAIETTLSNLHVHDTRKRSLEFAICNFIWLDVIATSTFGAFSYTPCAFDYLPILQSGIVRPEKIMGCQGWIMAVILKISRLEQWKIIHRDYMHAENNSENLALQTKQLKIELNVGIDKLENNYKHAKSASLEDDIRLVSIVWAYCAQVLLQVTVDDEESDQRDRDQTYVNMCLQKLESLPARLASRISWPYAVAGSMFREILGRTLREAQSTGMLWKALMVMEECWRLRRVRRDKYVGWREAMESLGARIMLT
ncbi:hypothetical protein DM02DRAFT_719118 [Periconia macrospinosa]|uniref:Zn(2)-C6 fungal-type domain-containing protein n=1 Tax=Periconia macrospinosa TaxID=97972 RepID=A0A2V1DLJ9_9PLEO|nr:hypothetical protein DM02DRAFT_719118 [Periconia macrospinosa]